jgi:hypothetical protein
MESYYGTSPESILKEGKIMISDETNRNILPNTETPFMNSKKKREVDSLTQRRVGITLGQEHVSLVHSKFKKSKINVY